LIISGCGAGQVFGPTVTPTPTPPTVGRIEGIVFDLYHEPITNMGLTLESGHVGVAETTTDSQGRYQFNDVKPGKYSISIHGNKEHKCFVITSVFDDIDIAAGDVVQKDFDFPC
jgi:protocatechuate 3,4-dioxygenase beta subunit